MSLFDLTTELFFSLKSITTSRKKIIIILKRVKDEFILEQQSSGDNIWERKAIFLGHTTSPDSKNSAQKLEYQ